MNDLELERLIDGISIVLARKSNKQRAIWIIHLIKSIVDEQVNTQHIKNQVEWIGEIGRACAHLIVEYGND